jgi:hypothetical protein
MKIGASPIFLILLILFYIRDPIDMALQKFVEFNVKEKKKMLDPRFNMRRSYISLSADPEALYEN